MALGIGLVVAAAGLLVVELAPPPATRNIEEFGSADTLTGKVIPALISNLQELWTGSPAVLKPTMPANTSLRYYAVTGSTQNELIGALNNSNLCTTYECAPDPAAPPGSKAWALEGANGSPYRCYAPATTTVQFSYFIVLPLWSPLPLTTTPTVIVDWNALLQVMVTHESRHVAIAKADIAALNAQAQRLASCAALIAFWSNPHVYDQLNADQNAYHAQLRADCRPDLGCIPSGWLGW